MAGRGDIEAGRAFVALYFKDQFKRQFSAAIDQARAKLSLLQAPGVLKNLQNEIRKIEFSKSFAGRFVAGIETARHSLKQFAGIVKPIGMALSKIGVAIGASYIAIASGNALVAQKAGLIHKTLANAIAPAVIPILERTLQIAQAFAKWASHNKNVLTNILRIGLWMVTIGHGLKLAALGAKGLAAALLVVQTVVATISTIIATTWLGPLLIALGVLVAIGAVAYGLSATFRQFFNQNMADVEVWAGNIHKSINSFIHAIADGRFALAWRVALLAAEIEYSKFNNAVTAGWSVAVSSIAKMLQIAWDSALAGMKLGWVTFQQLIITGWTQMLTPLASLLEKFAPLFDAIGVNVAGFAGAMRDTMKGMAAGGQQKMIEATLELVNAMSGTRKDGFFTALDATLKGMVADAKEGVELKAAMLELDKLRGDADKRAGFSPFSSAGQVKSSITAGGAAALTFGTATQDIATKSYNELQAIKKAGWETVKQMKEAAAKKERPGVFGR